MPNYICRTSKNFWIQVEAGSADEAAKSAEALDLETKWETSGFDDIEVEEDPPECECDSTHKQNDTVCRWCWARGRRHWNDPEVEEG